MKRVFTLSLAIAMAVTTCFASAVAPSFASAVTPSPGTEVPALPVQATAIRIPVGHTGKFINLQELATIKVADFEKMSGRKMGWLRRMQFKSAQKKLLRAIDKDGTVSNEKLAKMAGGYYDDDNSFHFGGFALGFFLGLIGIIIAYVINDDNHHRRVKWAWVGFGIWIAIVLIALAAAGAHSN